MYNNISSNVNFQGTFKLNFNKTVPNMRESFEKVLEGKGKTIIEDTANGDVFYVLKNSKDYDASAFIVKNELPFQYMPEVTTSSLINKLNDIKIAMTTTKSKVIESAAEMLDFIAENRTANRAVKPKVKTDYNKLLQNIFHNTTSKPVKDQRGVVTLRNETTGEFIKVSPKSKFGMYYVYHKPSLDNELPQRFAIDPEGNLVAKFQTPDSINKFDNYFIKAIKHHLHKD